jgi:hypothetical protein
MKWRKLGLVFAPESAGEWLQSHAANPVAEHLGDDLFRVYFSPRDSRNRSQIASILVNVSGEVATVVGDSLRHELAHGRNGRFDDSGVTVTGLVCEGSRRVLYYLGWNRAVTIPFRNAIGAAIAEGADGRFERVSEGPLVDRNPVDPISLSYPFLLRDGGRFRIWYGSCVEWRGSTVTDYEFSLKYAESADGLSWERTGEIALGCNYPTEDAVARPHVVREGGRFRMWYSRKKGPCYRIGYAESLDGHSWVRMDDAAGIDVSPGESWDSESIEYPFIFDHAGRRYMLYNGNGYGKTGFGLAVAVTG